MPGTQGLVTAEELPGYPKSSLPHTPDSQSFLLRILPSNTYLGTGVVAQW